jgi:hypothetical protein
MGQGWRRYRAGKRPRWMRIVASLSGMFLWATTGCRTAECELCRPGASDRKMPQTSHPTIGLPGTPTLPPGPSANSLTPTAQGSGLDSRLGSGTSSAPAPSATRRTPTSTVSGSGGGPMPASSTPAKLPPPQDLSQSGGSGLPPLSSPAMSNWAPATPLSSAPASPAPVGLQDPGPLPPPPPGATGNMPVLPPTPPPGTPQ